MTPSEPDPRTDATPAPAAPASAAPAPADADLAAAGWSPCPDQAGFIDMVGPFWQRPGDDGPRYGFVARPEHANLIGVVQGGMLMTFADRVLGLRAWSLLDGTPCVTVQFEMQFVSSARIGALVELQPEVVHRTNSLVFLRGVLTAQGRPVASATGIWKVLKRAARPEPAARQDVGSSMGGGA